MKIFVQLGIIAGLILVSNALSTIVPLPASILALLFLFVLLIIKVIHIKHINDISLFFKHNMAFFFLPASVGIIEVFDQVKLIWLNLLFICLVSTVLTFVATGWSVRLALYVQSKLSKKNGA
ncbi:MAG: CidA/LrgA family protein [Treponemataceae bacterium]